MIINTNILALNAYNNLQNTQMNLSSSLENLLSGYGINKAADDASGLVISEGPESQIDVTNTSTYGTAQTLVDGALNQVSNDRGQLRAVQNRLQATISNLQLTTQNLTASESSIVDTDMSLEMVNFTNDQILLQAGTAMLAQNNAAPQTILKLLG
jgi:flagellin